MTGGAAGARGVVRPWPLGSRAYQPEGPPPPLRMGGLGGGVVGGVLPLEGSCC
jgi:hypothetical protein